MPTRKRKKKINLEAESLSDIDRIRKIIMETESLSGIDRIRKIIAEADIAIQDITRELEEYHRLPRKRQAAQIEK
ncbi:hypothetical protein [Nitrososphaera sp. AFS]|uniref:hypothetical protein n=1 Tax=Nitrososphaera sp. AFS TaxID=2301191 RepID=UPI0013924463|nr:hypothetical protein [Nitrososphaera sp. AFS]NAL78415.1 hypothetical protein [Nitrososphaera sp. AFS]